MPFVLITLSALLVAVQVGLLALFPSPLQAGCLVFNALMFVITFESYMSMKRLDR